MSAQQQTSTTGRWRRFIAAVVVVAATLTLPVSVATVATAATTMTAQECNKLVAKKAIVQQSLATLGAHQAIKVANCSADGKFVTVVTEPTKKVATTLTGVVSTLPPTRKSCPIRMTGPDIQVLIGATWQIETRSGNKRVTVGRNSTYRPLPVPASVRSKELRLYVNGKMWKSTYDNTAPKPLMTWNYVSPWFSPATELEMWGNAIKNDAVGGCSATTAFPQ